MQIKVHLIISILLGLSSFNCKNNSDKALNTSQQKQSPDTLFFGNLYVKKFPQQYKVLSDSLMDAYMYDTHHAKSNTFRDLHHSSCCKNAYTTDTFFLGDETLGKVLFFKNEKWQWYNSLQLYLWDKKGTKKEVLEVYASFDDAGHTLDCKSILVHHNKEVILYTKIYDISRSTDYIDGAWQATDLVHDTIIAYKIKQGQKYPLVIDSIQQEELRQLFLDKER